MRANRPCAWCGRTCVGATCGPCRSVAANAGREPSAEHGLTGGEWVLDKRRRVQVWVTRPEPLLTPEQYARYVQHRQAFADVGAA